MRARISKTTLRHVLLRRVGGNRGSVVSGAGGGLRSLALSSVVSTMGGRSLLYVRLIRRVKIGLNHRMTKLVGVFGPRLIVVNNTLSHANSCLARPVAATVQGCALGLVGHSSIVMRSGLGRETKVVNTYVLSHDGLFRWVYECCGVESRSVA